MACDRERFGQWLDPDLLSVRTDEAYLAGADPIIDAGLVRSYRRSLLSTPVLLWLGNVVVVRTQALFHTRKRTSEDVRHRPPGFLQRLIPRPG
ncbi:MAG TPA: hypothetical protein VK966_11940, partial [Longimicrobiales bacterium]|nr:hypothetical protein [Longimicrobiales bacterium]